jgi:N-hydroxyarylamine O-acetyltransferase
MNPNLPLSQPALDAYLARIGHAGPLDADLATLTALHRAHVLSIPFENLDVQLGRPLGLDPQAAFDKLVTARRGGWCYEQNGLFGRALVTLGFAVTRMASAVLRAERGDFFMGSHLCLKVRVEGQDYLADVGFGSSQLEPIALAEQAWDQAPLAGRLFQTEAGYWQFAIEQGPTILNYDFHAAPADEAQFTRLCDWQGRDPESIFVQTLVVQQRRQHGHTMLRGKVLTQTGIGETSARELTSGEELVAMLRDVFALDVPEAVELWPQIEVRHAALFA